jgi:large subunit ribosomal protein L23
MNQERVFQILLGPHVSEKAAIVAEQANQYVFRVCLDATKDEIRQSVEQLSVTCKRCASKARPSAIVTV